MKLYEASHTLNKITTIEVERANATSYWTKTGRRQRFGNYTSVFDTWGGARDYLKARLERKISNAQRDIDRAKNQIKELNQLNP